MWKTLTAHEPIIDLILRPTSLFANALRAKEATVPAEIKIRALVDTGFTAGLAIDQSLVKSWGLRPRNFNRVSVPPSDDRFFDTYAWESDVGIKFLKAAPDGGNVLLDPVAATLLEFVDGTTAQALIGQEILQLATFVYDGPRKRFSLTFSRKFIPPK